MGRAPWLGRGLGLHMPQLSIIFDLHGPPWVMGEASWPEKKREANSIKHHRRKDEPVRASGREDTRRGWAGRRLALAGKCGFHPERRSALSISRLDPSLAQR